MTKIREGYKDTEIGVIPEDWEVAKLGEVSNIVSGGTPKTSVEEYWDNGNVFWATPTDITKNRGKYISSTDRLITETGLKNSSANLLPIGSVLMTSRATIGEKCINTVPMSTNQGFKSFICMPILSNEFLYYYIDIIKDDLLLNSSGSTFLEISKTKTENIKIAIPPLPEQQRIAEILSTTDAHIEKLDKIIEDYQLFKKGMMKKLLTEGIGHTEFKETEIGRIPKEWEVVQVVNTYDKQTKGLYEKLKSNQYKDIGNYPIIDQGQSFICGYIDEIDKLFKGELPVIVFGDHTRIIKFIDFPFAVGADGTQLLKAKKIFDDRFYYYSLCNLNLVNQGYSRHFKYLNESFIALPSKEEQVSIAKILSKFDENVMLFSKQRESYFDLKKALMEKLLTGKIRVDTGLLKGDSSPSFSMDGMVGQIIKNVK